MNGNFKFSLAVCLLALVGIIGPFLSPWKNNSNSFIFSVISLLILMIAVISAVITFQVTQKAKAIKNDTKLVAHWTYSDQEWAEFTEIENQRNLSDKKNLFIIIAVTSVIFSFIFLLADPENGTFVAYCMGALVIITGITTYISTKLAHLHNLHNKGDAYISFKGIIINDKCYPWEMLGNSFQSASQIKDSNRQYLQFSYSSSSRRGRQNHDIRIPVPAQEEKNVQSIINKLEKI